MDNFNEIKHNILEYLDYNSDKIGKLVEKYNFNDNFIEKDKLKNWKLEEFFIFGYLNKKLLMYESLKSHILNLTKNIKIVNISISILEKKQSIPIHDDIGGFFIRYHIPIQLKSDNNKKCFFIVDKNKFELEEGVPFIFDEQIKHGVVNNLDFDRVHLMIDIINPILWKGIKFNFTRSILKYIVLNDKKIQNNISGFIKI